MSGLPTFLIAQLALLLVPGPTNSLMATSGASVGVLRSLPLLPFELLGYETSVALMRAFVAPLLAHSSAAPRVLRAAAALYLLCLALTLWRTRWSAGTRLVRPHHMFVTTLLNPKTFITALVLWPTAAGTAAAAPWLVLTGLLPTIATVWISLGVLVARSATPRLASALPRIASGALGLFAALLLSSLLR
jgi:threonine/homoserine/homoserine lactone efflux protein